jgi:hypothetical protein
VAVPGCATDAGFAHLWPIIAQTGLKSGVLLRNLRQKRVFLRQKPQKATLLQQ